ncbi:MAG TPA: hydrogenase nickel incorporation protein HypB [Thermodesulfobacteriota bacterium]|nr:hydrogenase nickel incorporation protein HypB [Thermodesulfobacteriota bacterium]
MKISVVQNILEANQRIAEENRARFSQHKVLVINLMSSPGAGKTSLLEKTIHALKGDSRVGVIEGDIQSTYDAEKIEKTGAAVVQINTGGACHLDSNMIQQAMQDLDPAGLDLLFIENVGNLVCPAEFNLGENFKAMILSVAEGDDKPLKYPLMFHESKALVINKMDLLPFCDCSPDLIEDRALKINPHLAIFRVSCRTGEGLDGWTGWLKKQIQAAKE